MSPAGSGSGGTGGGAQAIAQRDQNQTQDREIATQLSEGRGRQNERAMADQALSVGAYRQARDTSPGAVTRKEQTEESTALGIDPKSSATDIASAASGPVTFDNKGMPAGGDTGGTGSVSPAQPNDVRNTILQIQAQKDGQQNTGVADSYAKGVDQATPFSPATNASSMPVLQTNPAASMTLRPPIPAGGAPPAPATPPTNQPATGLLASSSAPSPSRIMAPRAPGVFDPTSGSRMNPSTYPKPTTKKRVASY